MSRAIGDVAVVTPQFLLLPYFYAIASYTSDVERGWGEADPARTLYIILTPPWKNQMFLRFHCNVVKLSRMNLTIC